MGVFLPFPNTKLAIKSTPHLSRDGAPLLCPPSHPTFLGGAAACLPSEGRHGWLLQGRLVGGLMWRGQRVLKVLFCVRHWTSLAWMPPMQDLEHCGDKRKHWGSNSPPPGSASFTDYLRIEVVPT